MHITLTSKPSCVPLYSEIIFIELRGCNNLNGGFFTQIEIIYF